MEKPTQMLAAKVEVADIATRQRILYAQCWEDADVLLAGLAIQPGDTCLSIASAGDNTLALLTCDPERVIAVDLSPTQLACLELRVAAFQMLDRQAVLELLGSWPSARRRELYLRCRSELRSRQARDLWDSLLPQVERHGIGGVGRFERYLRLFRRFLLPLIHRKTTVRQLLKAKPRDARQELFDSQWNSWLWRTLIRGFGSRRVLRLLGREAAFFRYLEGNIGDQMLDRTRHVLTELDPAENPYVQWILLGHHATALPAAYRPGCFQRVRENLDRLEWHLCSVEQMSERLTANGEHVDKFNMSDIFEYMSEENYRWALQTLLRVGRSGSRLLYWNMMVPRTCPADLLGQVRPMRERATELFAHDKAFFYQRLNLDEIR